MKKGRESKERAKSKEQRGAGVACGLTPKGQKGYKGYKGRYSVSANLEVGKTIKALANLTTPLTP